MAPQGNGSDAAGEATVANAAKRPISTIVIVIGTHLSVSLEYLIVYSYKYAPYVWYSLVFIFVRVLSIHFGCGVGGVIAMQTEALPLVNKFQLKEVPDSVFPKGVPWLRYSGIYKGLNINIIWPGKDLTLGVDSIGTISASLVTYASIQALQPDLIINAGTAGGFKAKGVSVGDVFLASEIAFHDRRIPIPVFDLYGVGLRQAFSTPNLLKKLNLKVGKLSTGDSLDMSSRDEASIIANGATVKDMEGAAVAYVADLLKVPAIFVKAVTDIVDGEKPTAEEFLQNLVAVTAALGEAVTQVVDCINGKCLSEL